MAFSLDTVVPWGRSYDEYVAMFALTKEDLGRRVVGCGDGPAGFNRTLTKRGGDARSVDPIYRFSGEDIARRIDESYPRVMEQTRRNAQEFVWNHIPSLEALGRVRMAAMAEFLADYPAGLREGRYIPAQLPTLPFRDRCFGIALCSHFLFLYSAQLGQEFHLAAIREMCRVAEEARVFPLLELGSRPSRHLTPVIVALEAEGYHTQVATVDYEFQRGGNEMLRVAWS